MKKIKDVLIALIASLLLVAPLMFVRDLLPDNSLVQKYIESVDALKLPDSKVQDSRNNWTHLKNENLKKSILLGEHKLYQIYLFYFAILVVIAGLFFGHFGHASFFVCFAIFISNILSDEISSLASIESIKYFSNYPPSFIEFNAYLFFALLTMGSISYVCRRSR